MQHVLESNKGERQKWPDFEFWEQKTSMENNNMKKKSTDRIKKWQNKPKKREKKLVIIVYFLFKNLF